MIPNENFRVRYAVYISQNPKKTNEPFHKHMNDFLGFHRVHYADFVKTVGRSISPKLKPHKYNIWLQTVKFKEKSDV